MDALPASAPPDARIGRCGGNGGVFRSGNCEEHAQVAFAYLCRHAPPGLRLQLVYAFEPVDHAFLAGGASTSLAVGSRTDSSISGERLRWISSIAAR